MTSKIKIIYLYLIVVLVVIGIVVFSYFNAKSTAEALVGPSMEHVEVSEVAVRIIHGKQFTWVFKFTGPDIRYSGFSIYVSALGEVVLTNPDNLEKELFGRTGSDQGK